MFIDTHCHVSEEEVKEYLENAIKENVKIIVTSSEDLDSSLMNVRISNMDPEVFTCIGVHPSNVRNYKECDIDKYRELLKNDKVVAIGEIGLDYYYGKEDRELQIKVFRDFLKLASEVDKPVVIHSRDAIEDTINILKEYNVKGIIHCFSGSLEIAREYIKLGYKLGIGGVITFKNSKLKDTIKNISLDNIVLETDSPYLAPTPYRGKKNESKYIPIIAQCISDNTGVSLDNVMNITTNNAVLVYRLKNINMIK